MPITAVCAYFVLGPLLYLLAPTLLLDAGAWLINLPTGVVFAFTLYWAWKVIARVPADADAVRRQHSALDGRIGVVGFGLFYLLAWFGLGAILLNAAPL